MKYIVNSSQMKEIDDYAIETVAIPAIVLMERAALQVVDCIKNYAKITKCKGSKDEVTTKEYSYKSERILCVCGIGNNGADGIATARILHIEGYQADILLIGDEQKATDQSKQQLTIARNLGISIYNNIKIQEYTIIIDALFGIGLYRDITGIYEKIINDINSYKHLVFAIDIPSGLSADTGKPMGISIKADYTITFGMNKIGLILFPGCEYAGKVVVADIGFPQVAVASANLNSFIYDNSDLKRLPKRKEYSNKGTYGRVLVIAGSNNMSGACFFSAKAAYRSGAGLVKVLTVRENREIIQTLLPEAILSDYDLNGIIHNINIEKLLSEIEWATVIVFGPGIGVSQNSEKLLDVVVKNSKVPLIIDADGINIIGNKVSELIGTTCSNQSDIQTNRLEKIAQYLPSQTILTPHLKELSGLIGSSIEEITSDFIDIADKCTTNNKLIFTMKDARTIVAYDKMRYINNTGNSGMATGGTGDVLTGIIAAMIAQGLKPVEAAMLGVYIHGLAGDKAAEQKGKYALIASDVIEALATVCNLAYSTDGGTHENK